MKTYAKIKVTFPAECAQDGYMEFDQSSSRYTDMDGNTLVLPKVYEIQAIENEVTPPTWAN